MRHWTAVETNVHCFRCRLVFKARRLLCHSYLALKVKTKKRRFTPESAATVHRQNASSQVNLSLEGLVTCCLLPLSLAFLSLCEVLQVMGLFGQLWEDDDPVPMSVHGSIGRTFKDRVGFMQSNKSRQKKCALSNLFFHESPTWPPPFRRLVTTPQYTGGVVCVTTTYVIIQQSNIQIDLTIQH